MSAANETICYLNSSSIQTILEVEKILRALPKKGTRCELKVCTNRNGTRGSADVVAPKQSIRIRDEPRTIAPPPPPPVQSFVEEYEESPPTEASETSQKQSKIECKILADQVRVSPIVECHGVILEVDVEVTIPSTGKVKKMQLEIECPDFQPRRVKIGGKWKSIA